MNFPRTEGWGKLNRTPRQQSPSQIIFELKETSGGNLAKFPQTRNRVISPETEQKVSVPFDNLGGRMRWRLFVNQGPLIAKQKLIPAAKISRAQFQGSKLIFEPAALPKQRAWGLVFGASRAQPLSYSMGRSFRPKIASFTHRK
jgi:hypothetical protein